MVKQSYLFTYYISSGAPDGNTVAYVMNSDHNRCRQNMETYPTAELIFLTKMDKSDTGRFQLIYKLNNILKTCPKKTFNSKLVILRSQSEYNFQLHFREEGRATRLQQIPLFLHQ